MPGLARQHCAVSCAKMAELIKLPFGLWTLVAEGSTGSVVFARLRQYALMGGHTGCAVMAGHIGTMWRIRLNYPSVAVMRPYVKLL